MNNRGQALVEFILLLPIMILIIFVTYDFGNIYYNKTELQNDLSLIKELYEKDEIDTLNNYIKEKELTIDYKTNNNLTTIEVTKNVDTLTPFLENILNNKLIETITVMEE